MCGRLTSKQSCVIGLFLLLAWRCPIVCEARTHLLQTNHGANASCLRGGGGVYSPNTTQKAQNNCIIFIQRWTNVFDVGRTLHKCYTNVWCLLGTLNNGWCWSHVYDAGPTLNQQWLNVLRLSDKADCSTKCPKVREGGRRLRPASGCFIHRQWMLQWAHAHTQLPRNSTDWLICQNKWLCYLNSPSFRIYQTGSSSSSAGLTKVNTVYVRPRKIESDSIFLGQTVSLNRIIPANTWHWAIVGLMLGWRRRRRTNIEPTMAQCLVFAGI